MAVHINRVQPKSGEVVVELPPVGKTDSVQTTVQQVQKPDLRISKGRNYRHSKTTFPRPPKPVSEPKQKPLEQTPIKKYNVPRESEHSSRWYRCNYCKDTGKVIVYDVCDNCDGVGCPKCNNTGELRNYITCQDCKTIKGRY